MRCTGRKPLCIPLGFETDIQLFQRPESIRWLGDSRTDIEQQRQYWGTYSRKNPAKVPCKTEYNPIRPFVEKVDGLSFCQRSLPLRTWLKICSASQLKCYIAAGDSLIDGYAHLDYRSPISSAQAREQGMLLPRPDDFGSRWENVTEQGKITEPDLNPVFD